MNLGNIKSVERFNIYYPDDTVVIRLDIKDENGNHFELRMNPIQWVNMVQLFTRIDRKVNFKG